MIKFKKGQCKECSSEGDYSSKIIVNRKHMLCEMHNKVRLRLQGGEDAPESRKTTLIAQNRFSETFEYCTRWGFTREMDMYLHIWNERQHVSFFTGQPIFAVNPVNFVHILAKGLNKYPHYRLNPGNVVLGTREEHKLFDEGTEAQRLKYKKKFPQYDFPAFLVLRDKLADEYAREFDQ